MSATILPPANVQATAKPYPLGASTARATEVRPAPTEGASAAHIFKDLRLAAEKLDAIEFARIPLGQLAGDYESKGILDLDFLAYLRGVEAALKAEEHQATLALQRVVRKHPLGPWVKRTVGVGEKQAGRLLAALGPGGPNWNTAEDRARRGPAELWAFCGYSPDQKRRKGEKSNWNPTAKMRARLIAESCIKQAHSPYRAAYDQARATWADHDTTNGHRHNHALRVVAKAVLRDLWIEAHRLRGNHFTADTQATAVPADLPPTNHRPTSIVAPSAAHLEVAA